MVPSMTAAASPPPLPPSPVALGGALRSQLSNIRLMRGLFGPEQLLRGLRLPLHWYVRRDGSAPPPVALAHYITYECPEACSFCNVTHAVHDWQRHLDADASARLIERLVPWVPTVAIGGGEPLVYPGIFDHIGRIHARGGRVFLVTSATTLGPTRAAKLAALAPAVVTVSILGDQPTHDALMGRDGAWARAVGGVEALLSKRDPARTRVLLNCAISFENAGDLDAVVRLGRRLGVDRVRFTWLSFLTQQERSAEPHAVTAFVIDQDRLAGLDVDGLLARASRLERDHPGFVQFQPTLDAGERARWFQPGGGVRRRCFSLWHTLFLRPDASAVPCGHLFEDPVGNVLEQDPQALWNGPAMRAVRRAQWAQPFQICARCCKV